MLAQLERRHALAPRCFAHGETIFASGDAFHMLYVVRSGAVKLRTLAAGGAHETVDGFRLPGEWLGVKAIGHTMYPFDAIALGACSVWELPYRAVLDVCGQCADMSGGLTAARAQQTRRDRSWASRHAVGSADAAVAALIADLAARCAAQRTPLDRFVFAASNADIAAFLGFDAASTEAALQRLIDARCMARDAAGIRLLHTAPSAAG